MVGVIVKAPVLFLVLIIALISFPIMVYASEYPVTVNLETFGYGWSNVSDSYVNCTTLGYTAWMINAIHNETMTDVTAIPYDSQQTAQNNVVLWVNSGTFGFGWDCTTGFYRNSSDTTYGEWVYRYCSGLRLSDYGEPVPSGSAPSSTAMNEGWYNLGIGLTGLILIFSSWFVAKHLYDNGAYAEAIGYWLIMMVFGIGLLTVLVGG